MTIDVFATCAICGATAPTSADTEGLDWSPTAWLDERTCLGSVCPDCTHRYLNRDEEPIVHPESVELVRFLASQQES